MKMQIFRCRICGETYLGYEKPSQCPFCGAHEKFLVLGSVWKDEFDVPEMTELSKKNLETTLGFELSNSAFYKSAAEKAKPKSREIEGMFKRLYKIEWEHASGVKKFLKLSEISEISEEAFDDILENLKAASQRESNALKHYTQFAEEAEEPRLKEFWTELSEIEKDHFGIDTDEQEKFK